MTVAKVPQKTTQMIDALQWGVSGNDAEAAAETRKQARLCGPDCVASLHHVVRSDNFASITQRVRAASTLLEAGGFLSSEAKETGARREEWQEQKKLARLLDKWLDPACTFWTATVVIGVERRDTEATRRQARRAGRSGLVSREINWPRAEIAGRPVQSIAARGARGDVAGGRRMVGMSLGARRDVGSPQVGREVPHDRPRGRQDRVLAATPNCRRGRCRSATRTSGGRGRRSGSRGRRRRLPSWRQRVTMELAVTSPLRNYMDDASRKH